MPELTTDFHSLPEEYQHVIRLAQEQHKITVAPLQLLVGGWSGAVVYHVSVSSNEILHVEHCILKLDRKNKNARSDEVTRHSTVMDKASPEFVRDHIAVLAFDRVEHEGAIAIFYRIAGQSLLNYLPLSKYERESQLNTIFTQTNTVLLEEWNSPQTFEQAVQPQKVLEKWLGFRLDAGRNIEQFLQDACHVNPDTAGLLINGHVFPNPLPYARDPELWGKARPIDIATGSIHGDLNTNNILVKFSDDKESLAGYYLIDFALFKDQMPLLYDQRYLEMSYLMHSLSQVSFAKFVDFLTLLAVADIPDPHKVPIEMAGVSTVIRSARSAFGAWVQENHPSLHDDLWGQYWLAGVAAGLAYCHKAGQPDEQRLAGLIYAAVNLRRYTSVFKLPLPTNVELLYDKDQEDKDSPGSPQAGNSKHNLPSQPTHFIGRARQVTALKDLISKPDVHLVTLMGPGGTGKTRLSLQVAQEMLDDFPDGVFFVPLADDTEENQFISRIAQQLSVREGGRPLLENLKDYLQEKKMLLVFDNFEQLVSAAPIVAELLAAAPKVKIITSSRIALQLQSEHEYPVPPLDLPRTDGNVSVEELLENEAVVLFVERARTALPNFVLTEDNASAIAEICRRLDGLPLALELAAARVKILNPQAILTRLDDSLKLLTGGARDLPARHQTLRNTLEWSYELLDANEKILYARLGAFVGGFTLETAEAICNLEDNPDILEGLTSLANNSLLIQKGNADGEPRFGMLETIRAHALERLAESGELDALRQAHAQHFGEVILNQIGFTELYSTNALHWLNWIESEHDNIRAALAWTMITPGTGQFGTGIISTLGWFWYRRGYLIEGRMWCEQLLESPELQTASTFRVMALGMSGMIALWQGRQDDALAQLQEGMAIEEELGEKQWEAVLLMGVAVSLINMGEDRKAQPMLEKSHKMFKEQNNLPLSAITRIHLGNAELGLGNIDKARTYHEEALAEARVIRENWLLSFALNNLGEVARTQGQFDKARKYYEECETLLRATGDRGDVARFVHNLGYIAQHEEEFERADSQFRKSLTMFRRLGNRRGMAECMAGLAGLKARMGQTEWGATMLSAAESVLQVTGGAWWPADRVEVDRNREMIKAALDSNSFDNAWEKGKTMSLEQALAFATEDQ